MGSCTGDYAGCPEIADLSVKHHPTWAADSAMSFPSCLLSASSLPLPSPQQPCASSPSASNNHYYTADKPRTDKNWPGTDGHQSQLREEEEEGTQAPSLVKQRALVKATSPPSLCALSCKILTNTLPIYRAKVRSNTKTVCGSALQTIKDPIIVARRKVTWPD